MVRCPVGLNAFEFCVLAGLRAAQLQRGCAPRVQPREKIAITAQVEVAERQVTSDARVVALADGHEPVA